MTCFYQIFKFEITYYFGHVKHCKHFIFKCEEVVGFRRTKGASKICYEDVCGPLYLPNKKIAVPFHPILINMEHVGD